VVENLVEELQGDDDEKEDEENEDEEDDEDEDAEAEEEDAATGPAWEALTWLVASAIQLVLRYGMCVCVCVSVFL
jgi:uncharacterized membrane protein YdbT with pleckstrin-like domain